MNISNDMTLLKIKYSQTAQKASTQSVNQTSDATTFNRKLKAAADGFEELFVHQMVKEMRKTIDKTGLLDGGRGEEIFQDMLDEDYSKIISKSGALGLSHIIYEANKKPDDSPNISKVPGEIYR